MRVFSYLCQRFLVKDFRVLRFRQRQQLCTIRSAADIHPYRIDCCLPRRQAQRRIVTAFPRPPGTRILILLGFRCRLRLLLFILPVTAATPGRHHRDISPCGTATAGTATTATTATLRMYVGMFYRIKGKVPDHTFTCRVKEHVQSLCIGFIAQPEIRIMMQPSGCRQRSPTCRPSGSR